MQSLKTALVVAVLATIAIVGTARLPAQTRIVRSPADFRAFYCAGEALRTHHDPYLAEPLRSCEIREVNAVELHAFPELAVPAPLPGSSLIPFALLGFFGFARASTLYALLQLATTAATAILISRATKFSLLPVFAALILSDGILAIVFGQIFPFSLLAICASAYALVEKRYASASVFAACATLEPHVALPALAALVFCVPKSRVSTLACVAVLALISLFALGFDTNVEYFTRVLAAQARSEAFSGTQFSLTTLLTHADVSIGAALAIANVQFVLVCALGIVVGRRLAQRYDAPELIVFVPVAFSALGGPYLHLTQTAVVVPALFALMYRIPERRAWFACALILAAIPWSEIVENDIAFELIAVAMIAAPIAFAVWRRSLATVAIVASVLALAGAEHAFRAAYPTPVLSPGTALAGVAGGERLAQDSWTAYEDAIESSEADRKLPARMPIWVAILALTAITTRLALPPSTLRA